MLPKPHLTPDSFFHKITPTPSPPLSSPWPTTVYFISGNPGLISYYHAFLSLLAERLNPSSSPLEEISEPKSNSTFHIFGHSLAGFELGSSAAGAERREEQERYFDVEDQIQFLRGKLQGHMQSLRMRANSPYASSSSAAAAENESRQRPRPKVILIGHSVGSYMAMEVLRRHREEQAADADFDILGGIMLFPTVMHIAKSPSGQKLTFLLRIIPQLAIIVSFFAWILTMVLPNPILRAVVRFVMRSPPETAVDATSSFLKSRRGVRQALHMAADEMKTITSDKWSDDVWGVARPSGALTRLFFYFGRNDHWVAEQTREEIVALRGRTKTGPRMIVCEDSVPHAFCLRHNETMATKVADMIREIMG
ncbi:hypothetical protein BDW59DRAFT_176621 [Aspergillus cavernicola]|uniref:Lipid droplet-associated hydrolase n=1 Tax=Aspergillus cavernicola TaxID=176166 RepID=A0ABR4HEF5_9EURO